MIGIVVDSVVFGSVERRIRRNRESSGEEAGQRSGESQAPQAPGESGPFLSGGMGFEPTDEGANVERLLAPFGSVGSSLQGPYDRGHVPGTKHQETRPSRCERR